ncbi:MAG: cytochrome c, partial [Chloroflexales bacterium]
APAAPAAPLARPSPTPAAGGGAAGGAAGGPFNADLAAKGEKLFTSLGCVGCHVMAGGGLGPSLKGVYNSTVTLDDDTTVKADEAYLHESIVSSPAKTVKGYSMIMPVFKSQLKDDEVKQLIEYVKSLGSGN